MYSPQTRIAPVPDAYAAPAALPTAERPAEGLIDDCVRQLVEARLRTRAVMASLDGEALLGPRLPIVNPPLWELGHLGWFQERWMLRPRGDGALAPSSLPGADTLYDSAQVAHSLRWDLPLPSLAATWVWLDKVMALALDGLERERRRLGDHPGATTYFAQLAARHEQMHSEAFVYSAQSLGYTAPAWVTARCDEFAGSRPGSGAHTNGAVSGGDVEIAGGRFLLGAEPGTGFAFDNEKWAHPVSLEPYAIARCTTRVAEYLAFVEDGGYAERRWWSEAGWAWRGQAEASAPAYWRRLERRQGWEQRRFEQWEALPMNQPMIHVNAHEAAAWCVWAGRRLPTEAEWEFAAATVPGGGPDDAPGRRYPWGTTVPGPALANLWSADGAGGSSLLAAGALAAGDSAWGCRQMIGNVWEWTASQFQPYPGFVTDPYREYSEPWFGTHQVLRGGCFATAADLISNTWRNFYTPERRDVFAGFRSCAGERR